MILIKLEDGLVRGVFSTDASLVGKSAIVSDYDPDTDDEGDDAHGVLDVFKDGKLAHISAVDMEPLNPDIACQFWEATAI